jgi:N,N'-diacetyllegionaminate synthase
MNKTEFIIEVANTHGGSKSYLFSLIDEFKQFDGHGMKFQPLHPDRLATTDFEWYKVYQEIYFNSKEWSEIIGKTFETKKVWLDIFDTYGVEILKQNHEKIHGIKLQASILYNVHVIEALSKTDCSQLKLIVNISAIEKAAIKERLEYLQTKICPQEILLEVGFQAYPTEIKDSGLNKISHLKNTFSNKIVFADHIDGKLDDALTLPLMASMLDADFIEKHVMHSSLDTKYDHFSSINVTKYKKLTDQIQTYKGLIDQPFINQKEVDYLKNSIQKPIVTSKKNAGQGLSINEDLSFKRSGKLGLSVDELNTLLEKKYILAKDVEPNETLKREDFKKANIAVIIAGRLKSSRLKRKALLNIGEITSVERCIKSSLNLPDTNFTVLATSTKEEDQELENYTYAPQVIFHQGHPEDVIQRYLDITDKLKIDVVIRVTADMPFVSKEITEYLLKSHFLTGADYTAAKDCAVGTSPEIINVQALKKVKEHFPNADYSEYMTWYFQNNKDYFKVNIVDLPKIYVRNYRLTIDYQEDLTMLNEIQLHLDEGKLEGSLIDIFNFLDNNPKIVELNDHITLKYKTDKKLIDKLNSATKIKID